MLSIETKIMAGNHHHFSRNTLRLRNRRHQIKSHHYFTWRSVQKYVSLYNIHMPIYLDFIFNQVWKINPVS